MGSGRPSLAQSYQSAQPKCVCGTRSTRRKPKIERWRDEIVRCELIQPFKQIYREQYVLTPAELDSGQRSSRFAKHVLRVDQLFALMKGRGWQAKWMGSFHEGRSVTPRLILAEGRYRFGFDLALDSEHGFNDCAVSGSVHFDQLVGKSWRPLDLVNVPPLVFSEAMRDVDLFVSIATVANDPNWPAQRLQGAEHAAWDARAHGAPTPSSGSATRSADTYSSNLKDCQSMCA
jgi:Domain of unknown function (DUF4132)